MATDEVNSKSTDPLRPHFPSYPYANVRGGTPGSSSDSDSSTNSEYEGGGALFVAPPQRRKASASDYSPPGSEGSPSESVSDTNSSGSDCPEPDHHRQTVNKRVQFLEDSESSSLSDSAPADGLRLGSQPAPPSYPPYSSDFGYPLRRKATRNVTYVESEGSDSDIQVTKWHHHQKNESDSEFEIMENSESPSEESFMDESSGEEYRPEGWEGGGRRRRRKMKPWEGDEDSDSDYMPGGRRKRKTSRRTIRRRNEGYMHEPGYGSGQSSSGSEFEPGRLARRNQKPSDFVRMTGRKKGVVSYKETSGSDSDVVERQEQEEVEEDNREAIERVLRKRTGHVGDTGDKTTCYAWKRDTSPPSKGEATEVQYLVKWLKWSHLHNTWETEETLLAMNVKGMKRFYNFLKREEEREAWEHGANPEDIEYAKCQEELQEQLLEHVTHVERVIAARHSEDGSQEYLCKWRGLPYSEVTWEDGELISDQFQEQIDSFLERNTSDRIPGRSAKVLRHRPRFSIMREQLRSFGGPGHLLLRDYQLDGVNWLCHTWCKFNSVILADEMGLGKTIQTIAFLHCLYHDHALYGPFLLVVPLSTMPAWQREFELWAPEINTIVYLGDVTSRNMIREYEWMHANRRLKFNVMLTTYEILLKDQVFLGAVAWAVLVVDEAHRLKNDDSLLYRTLMQFRTNHRLLVTGTPLQNSLKELWSLLHFIMEKKFPDWEQFEAEHRVYGEGDASSLTSLHQQLEPFLLRRVKKDVEKSLPAKVEQILRVEMSSVQKQYYRWILTKNYKALSKGVKGSITGFINLVMELKKCCNHIWIVRAPDEWENRSSDKLQTLIRGSGKLFLLDKLLVRLRQTGHRVLIFSQMVRMLDILAEYMQFRHFPFQRLDGSIRGELRRDAIDHFNAEGSQDFCFLLSTRAGGLGVNLATADTVVIFDSDWNPQNDLQAQARAHRIGQTKQVNIYRLVTRSSVEEDIVERAKRKMVLDHLVIQRMDTTGRTVLSQSNEPSKSVPFNKEELTAILKFGVVELFKEGEKEGDHDLQELDIDDILRRAETQSATEESSTANDLLSQFKMANFAMDEEELGEDSTPTPTPTEGKTLLLSPTNEAAAPCVEEKGWDEIIPKSYLAKIEEEERTKEQLQLYLPPRRRHVQNYCEDSPTKKKPPTVGRRKGRREMVPAGGIVISKNIRGFSDNEIRRFVRSYRKFGNPKSRLEAIAADAELQEKSLSELERLVDTLHQGCVQASTEHAAWIVDNPDSGTDKGPSLRLSGVTISAASILHREEELLALTTCVPDKPAARKRYRLLARPKPVGWGGVRWSAVDDAKLLIGVYEHGLGNWESVKDDPTLGLSKKILPAVKSAKPQASHLQTRVEYLLKLLQNEARKARKKSAKAPPRVQSTSRKKAPTNSDKISKYFPREQPPSKSSGSLTVNIPRELVEVAAAQVGRKRPAPSHSRPSSSAKKLKPSKAGSSVTGGRSVNNSGREERGEREGRSAAVAVAEMDIGDVELEKNVFQKCKSLLRPVKKSLGSFTPSDELSEQKTLDHYKKALLEIGDHIATCLLEYKSEEKIAEWRTNLWVFVSKFTSVSAQKLHKMYKKAKRETEKHQQPAMMPVKKRYLDMAAHASQHNDSKSHREHYDPGYRPSPPLDTAHTSHHSDNRL